MTKSEVSESEADIQRTVLSWLKLYRIFHYRQNTGAVQAEHHGARRFFKFGTLGAPDIVCIIQGRYVGIEVKSKYGQQSEHQVQFQKDLERAGGLYVVARSVADVEFLREHL